MAIAKIAGKIKTVPKTENKPNHIQSSVPDKLTYILWKYTTVIIKAIRTVIKLYSLAVFLGLERKNHTKMNKQKGINTAKPVFIVYPEAPFSDGNFPSGFLNI